MPPLLSLLIFSSCGLQLRSDPAPFGHVISHGSDCVSIVIYLEGLLIQALKLMTSIVLLYVSNLYLGFRRHGLISVYASCQAHGIWFGRFIDPLFPKAQEGSEGCYNVEGTDICAYEVNAMRRGSDCLITRCPLWWTHACQFVSGKRRTC